MTLVDVVKKHHLTVIENDHAIGTIVFIHGFGTDQTSWEQVSAAFASRYRMVLFDTVGGGNANPKSFSPNKYDSLHSYADDLLDICNVLGLRNAIVIAHSVGCMISLLAAIKEPEHFSKMVWVAASPRYLNDLDYIGGFDQESLDALYRSMSTNYYAWVSGFSAAAMRNEDRPGLSENFAQTLSAIRPDIAQSVARVIFQSDHLKSLPELEKRILLIQSKEDMAVPAEVAQYLHQHVKGSTLVEVDAYGHLPHISAPEAIIAAVESFI